MSSRNTSISFDRAADFYDRTRSVSSDAAIAVTDMLEHELGGRSVLEIGVGTGRVALPLHQRGVSLTGVDLSRPMMLKLIEHVGKIPFPLVQADAMRLPLSDSTFDAVVASWVLHLVADWTTVVDEIVRVLRRGGVVLITEGGPLCGESIPNQITKRFRDASGVEGWPRGPVDLGQLDAAFEKLGAKPRDLPPIPESRTETIEAHIAALEAGIFSVAWDLTPEQRKEAADQVRAWARAEFGDLDEPRTVEVPHTWRAYDLSSDAPAK